MKNTDATPEARERKRLTKEHAQAFDEMCARRPRKGPPLRADNPLQTAGARALAGDIKSGAYYPAVGCPSFGKFANDDDDQHNLKVAVA